MSQRVLELGLSVVWARTCEATKKPSIFNFWRKLVFKQPCTLFHKQLSRAWTGTCLSDRRSFCGWAFSSFSALYWVTWSSWQSLRACPCFLSLKFSGWVLKPGHENWMMLSDPHCISHALGFFVWLPLFLPCIPLLWNNQPDITVRYQ